MAPPRKEHKRPVALVTGAGRRLGRRIALALGRSGYDVAVNYHRTASGARAVVAELKAMGVNAVAVSADVGSSRDVRRMFRMIDRMFGRIDVLVNNAAIFRSSSITRYREDDWDLTLGTNLKGPYLCSREVIPIMQRQGSGRIINIASLGGIQAWKEHLPYSVSKAGLIHLTRILAKALAPEIIVNAVAPGTIIIPGEEDPELKHVPVSSIPLRRYGTPEDICEIVIFLATKNSYITGQVITVDGGRSII